MYWGQITRAVYVRTMRCVLRERGGDLGSKLYLSKFYKQSFLSIFRLKILRLRDMSTAVKTWGCARDRFQFHLIITR